MWINSTGSGKTLINRATNDTTILPAQLFGKMVKVEHVRTPACMGLAGMLLAVSVPHEGTCQTRWNASQTTSASGHLWEQGGQCNAAHYIATGDA